MMGLVLLVSAVLLSELWLAGVRAWHRQGDAELYAMAMRHAARVDTTEAIELILAGVLLELNRRDAARCRIFQVGPYGAAYGRWPL